MYDEGTLTDPVVKARAHQPRSVFRIFNTISGMFLAVFFQTFHPGEEEEE